MHEPVDHPATQVDQAQVFMHSCLHAFIHAFIRAFMPAFLSAFMLTFIHEGLHEWIHADCVMIHTRSMHV